MATDLERLVVNLSANITSYQRALDRANGITNTRTRQIETRFKAMQANINSSFNGVASGAARAFALIGGARGLQSLSDTGTAITNSLRVAGLEGENLERVYNDLKNAALANAAPLQTLSQLYGRISLVQKELGVDTQRLTMFSQNVALALRVGGQTSQEASGALLQLSQALGSGVVMAQEFNSVLEGAPVILQTAAAGIKQANGSVAELRKIMLDGKLSSKAFFDGFEAGAPILEDRVAGSVFTISQRLENLQTVLIDSVRDFNKSTNAAQLFGTEIDNAAKFINSINFNQFIGEIQKVYKELQDAAADIKGFFNDAANFTGFNEVGGRIAKALGSDTGSKSILGGLVTFGGQEGAQQAAVSNERELERIARERLDVENQINHLKSLPAEARAGRAIADQQNRLGELDQSAAKVTDAIQRTAAEAIQNAINNSGTLEYPTATPVVRPDSVRRDPIDITESQYKVDDEKSKKARKERLDDYQKEVTRIREKTDALSTETAAQEKLNPLVNDYGFAVEFARAQQDLMNAAISAGKQVTPELASEIDNLARAYAMSSVEAEKLGESQGKIKDRQQEILDLQKDVTRGLVDDLLEGKDAAEVFNNALKKIASTLLDSAFEQFFNPTSSGGIGGFGGLFKLLTGSYASGGYTGPGGKYEPAGVVHKGEYVIPKNVVDSLGVGNLEKAFGKGYANGGYVNSSFSRAPSSLGVGSSQPVQAVYSPTIDARGADVAAVARLERIISEDRRNFGARVEATVVKARASNKKGF